MDSRHRVGDLGDYCQATLAHAHLLRGRTLVFDGDADEPSVTVYGTPRTGLVTLLKREEMATHRASVGRCFPDVDVFIVGSKGDMLQPSEVGDIWVSSRDVVPPPGIPRGLAPTGDRGSVDADGFLYVEASRPIVSTILPITADSSSMR